MINIITVDGAIEHECTAFKVLECGALLITHRVTNEVVCYGQREWATFTVNPKEDEE